MYACTHACMLRRGGASVGGAGKSSSSIVCDAGSRSKATPSKPANPKPEPDKCREPVKNNPFYAESGIPGLPFLATEAAREQVSSLTTMTESDLALPRRRADGHASGFELVFERPGLFLARLGLFERFFTAVLAAARLALLPLGLN